MSSRRKNYRKAAKKLSVIFGSIYMSIGFLFSFICLMDLIYSPQKRGNMLGVSAYIQFIYVLSLFLAGVCYFLFGILYYKIGTNKFRIHLVLGILAFLWGSIFIRFWILNKEFFNEISAFATNGIDYSYIIIMAIMLIVFTVIFLIPPFIIGFLIKKQKLLNQ